MAKAKALEFQLKVVDVDKRDDGNVSVQFSTVGNSPHGVMQLLVQDPAFVTQFKRAKQGKTYDVTIAEASSV